MYCFDYRADDMSDQTTTPTIVPANAALLRDIATLYDTSDFRDHFGPSISALRTALRLRALADALDKITDEDVEIVCLANKKIAGEWGEGWDELGALAVKLTTLHPAQ